MISFSTNFIKFSAVANYIALEINHRFKCSTETKMYFLQTSIVETGLQSPLSRSEIHL